MEGKKSDFISSGVRCDGDLYLPEGVANPPVVIMAHGMAAFLFDYRTFGKSDGTPRQIVDPFRHVQDWEAAIAHVRSLPEVDGSRIALWGSSFSGGHVITCAAADHDIAAVVSQVPFVSGWSSIPLKPFPEVLLCTIYGLYDIARSAIGFSPHYSTVVAYPGTFAAMNTEESYPGYLSIASEGAGWENKMTSRGFIGASLYNPAGKSHKVKAPTLVLAGKNDSLIPVDAVRKMAERLPRGELVVMDCNHFEPYTGELFEQFVGRESDFLETHLK